MAYQLGWKIKQNKDTNRQTFFFPEGGGASTASFNFAPEATQNLLRVGVAPASTVGIKGKLLVDGDLEVTGTITPDYVLTPEYALGSIEDHAAYMWEHPHLPAIRKGKGNDQDQTLINVAAPAKACSKNSKKRISTLNSYMRK